jgi:hypothetical protein
MKAIDLRVREETLALTRALALQRGVERAALLRDALEVGMLLIAASGPPAAHDPADTYGILAGWRLAQLLRPRLAPALDFLSRYSATPVVTLPPTGLPPAPPAAPQPVQPVPERFTLDVNLTRTLDAFGVGALGDDE